MADLLGSPAEHATCTKKMYIVYDKMYIFTLLKGLSVSQKLLLQLITIDKADGGFVYVIAC